MRTSSSLNLTALLLGLQTLLPAAPEYAAHLKAHEGW